MRGMTGSMLSGPLEAIEHRSSRTNETDASHDRNVGVAVGQLEVGPFDQHRFQVSDGVLRCRSVGPRAGAALDGRDEVLGVVRVGDDRLPGSRRCPPAHLFYGSVLRACRAVMPPFPRQHMVSSHLPA